MIAWLAVAFGINSTRNVVNCTRLRLMQLHAPALYYYVCILIMWLSTRLYNTLIIYYRLECYYFPDCTSIVLVYALKAPKLLQSCVKRNSVARSLANENMALHLLSVAMPTFVLSYAYKTAANSSTTHDGVSYG